MTARETLTTTLTNLLARTRNGRMDAHRAEAERLVGEALREVAHGLADEIRTAPFETHLLQKHQRARVAGLIDPALLGDDFDTLLRASEQRAEEKREARTYPYDLEVGQ